MLSEWLDFGTKVVEAGAWPATSVLLLLLLRWLFKGELRALLLRLQSVRFRGGNWDFQASLHGDPERERLEGERMNLALPPSPVDTLALSNRADDSLPGVPRAAVIEGWLRFEVEVVGLLQQESLLGVDRPMRDILRELRRLELLDGGLDEMLRELRNYRNYAAHELDFNPDRGFVEEYVNRLELAIALLRFRLLGERS